MLIHSRCGCLEETTCLVAQVRHMQSMPREAVARAQMLLHSSSTSIQEILLLHTAELEGAEYQLCDRLYKYCPCPVRELVEERVDRSLDVINHSICFVIDWFEYFRYKVRLDIVFVHPLEGQGHNACISYESRYSQLSRKGGHLR